MIEAPSDAQSMRFDAYEFDYDYDNDNDNDEENDNDHASVERFFTHHFFDPSHAPARLRTAAHSRIRRLPSRMKVMARSKSAMATTCSAPGRSEA
jgi:hypothetical protein